MPRLIETNGDEAITLDELIDTLNAGPFDPFDDECISEWGPALKRLANDRRFLGDLVIEELKQRCVGQVQSNHYGAQVILLHHRPGRFAIRANFWPAEEDSALANSGRQPFFYEVPHDHNFSFLTVGYLGPGYWSDYYEYDYDRVVGFPGEKVDLRFVERSRLNEGKVMLYRRHRDVHRQLPPDGLSVSLNILALSSSADFRDQYRFDVERSEIAGIVNNLALEPLVRLAAHCGGENGRDLIDSFAETHPSGRARFAAWQAKASLLADPDSRIALYEQAASRTTGLTSALAARESERIKATRHWIEQQPTLSACPSLSCHEQSLGANFFSHAATGLALGAD